MIGIIVYTCLKLYRKSQTGKKSKQIKDIKKLMYTLNTKYTNTTISNFFFSVRIGQTPI